jgi:hypothetical protein
MVGELWSQQLWCPGWPARCGGTQGRRTRQSRCSQQWWSWTSPLRAGKAGHEHGKACHACRSAPPRRSLPQSQSTTLLWRAMTDTILWYCMCSECCHRTCYVDGSRVLPNRVRLAVVGRALLAFVTAVRGCQTSHTRTGPIGCSSLTVGWPGGHEWWSSRTYSSG